MFTRWVPRLAGPGPSVYGLARPWTRKSVKNNSPSLMVQQETGARGYATFKSLEDVESFLLERDRSKKNLTLEEVAQVDDFVAAYATNALDITIMPPDVLKLLEKRPEDLTDAEIARIHFVQSRIRTDDLLLDAIIESDDDRIFEPAEVLDTDRAMVFRTTLKKVQKATDWINTQKNKKFGEAFYLDGDEFETTERDTLLTEPENSEVFHPDGTDAYAPFVPEIVTDPFSIEISLDEAAKMRAQEELDELKDLDEQLLTGKSNDPEEDLDLDQELEEDDYDENGLLLEKDQEQQKLLAGRSVSQAELEEEEAEEEYEAAEAEYFQNFTSRDTDVTIPADLQKALEERGLDLDSRETETLLPQDPQDDIDVDSFESEFQGSGPLNLSLPITADADRFVRHIAETPKRQSIFKKERISQEDIINKLELKYQNPDHFLGDEFEDEETDLYEEDEDDEATLQDHEIKAQNEAKAHLLTPYDVLIQPRKRDAYDHLFEEGPDATLPPGVRKYDPNEDEHLETEREEREATAVADAITAELKSDSAEKKAAEQKMLSDFYELSELDKHSALKVGLQRDKFATKRAESRLAEFSSQPSQKSSVYSIREGLVQVNKTLSAKFDPQMIAWDLFKRPHALHESELEPNAEPFFSEEAVDSFQSTETFIPSFDREKELVAFNQEPFLIPKEGSQEGGVRRSRESTLAKHRRFLDKLDPAFVDPSRLHLITNTQAIPDARVPQLEPNGDARGIGKRKCAQANVILRNGSGRFIVNGKPLVDYFICSPTCRYQILFPLVVTERLLTVDVFAEVSGGGIIAQSEAIKLAVARALQNLEPNYRLVLKNASLLTVDPRSVERKKAGLKKARRAFQWVKR
eukprot:TRINITY_DN6197_c1_g2_i1.p1 TRINITY_DN6197_c1_g2~~TRINITY_DN6197_c1_g2_i1.p1  ORF type:complete len:922 (-),score=459.48 TRINITY_DN6197_c1_g2_i1:48-2636(-)